MHYVWSSQGRREGERMRMTLSLSRRPEGEDERQKCDNIQASACCHMHMTTTLIPHVILVRMCVSHPCQDGVSQWKTSNNITRNGNDEYVSGSSLTHKKQKLVCYLPAEARSCIASAHTHFASRSRCLLVRVFM